MDYKEIYKKTDCPKCKEELKEEKIDFNLKNLLNELIKINCENCNKDVLFENIESHFMETCEKINKIYFCNLCNKELVLEEHNKNKNKNINKNKKRKGKGNNIDNDIEIDLNFNNILDNNDNDDHLIKSHLEKCEGILYQCLFCEKIDNKFLIEKHLIEECKGKVNICERCGCNIYVKFSRIHNDFICGSSLIINNLLNKIIN